jgi:hypothetical protein
MLPQPSRSSTIAAAWTGPTALATIIFEYARPTKDEALIAILERSKQKNRLTLQFGAGKLNIMWPRDWNDADAPWRERRYCISISNCVSGSISFNQLFNWPTWVGSRYIYFGVLEERFHRYIEQWDT